MSLIVKNFFENVNFGGNATKISEEISQRLLQSGLQPGSNVPLAAYLLYKVAQNNSNSDVTIQDIFEGRLDISEGTRYFAKEQLPEEAWAQILPMVDNYTAEEFALAALLPEHEDEMKLAMATPHTILTLVHHLLDVQPDEYVGDLCCGSGSGFVSFAMNQPEAHYFGYEINEERGGIAAWRCISALRR